MALLIKGEALVSKLAAVAKYVVFPGTMVAALLYSPPQYSKPKKTIGPADA